MAQLTELRHNSQIMPKQIPQDEFDAILEAVTQFSEGASAEDLCLLFEVKNEDMIPLSSLDCIMTFSAFSRRDIGLMGRRLRILPAQ